MKYNKDEFKAWLEENLKDTGRNDIWTRNSFKAHCEDLERQHNTTGQNCYELTHLETASGNPEEYSYAAEEEL